MRWEYAKGAEIVKGVGEVILLEDAEGDTAAVEGDMPCSALVGLSMALHHSIIVLVW